MISSLIKIKGRSFKELTDRGRQSVSTLAERFGVSKRQQLLDGTSLIALFDIENIRNEDDLVAYFRSRKKAFYASVDDREEIIATLRNNFPDSEKRIIEAAEKICDGSFDLLGFKDLDFGRPIPDWFLEPVSGKRSLRVHWSQIDEVDAKLSGDKKIVWELNRHQYFTVLGRAYWFTDDERFVTVFTAHIRDWIANNPPKLGLNWRSSLEIAFRSISWIWAFYFFRDSVNFGPELLKEMLKILYLNGQHIEGHLSTYSSPNTHLTGEALGLFVLGTFFEATAEGRRWQLIGRKVLREALEFQFRDDGGYVEQSTHYHRYSADFYLSLWILETAADNAVEDRFRDVARKMLNFLLHMSRPDGQISMIGDEDGGRVHFFDGRELSDARSTLAVGAILLDEPEMKFVAGEPSEELVWLTGVDGSNRFCELSSNLPSETAAFRASGFFVGRSGWEHDSSSIIIRCGEHGFLNGAHAHADALGFVLTVKGDPIFVDSGTFTYTGEQRNKYRSSPAHNCVSVNGHSSSQPDGPFSWKTRATSKLLEWKTENGSIHFRGTHDGFERTGVKYEREIVISSWASMTLIDKFETFSNNRFNITLILSPAVETELIDSMQIVLRLRGERNARIKMRSEVGSIRADGRCGWRIDTAKISPRYGSEVDTTRLTFDISSEEPFYVENRFEFL